MNKFSYHKGHGPKCPHCGDDVTTREHGVFEDYWCCLACYHTWQNTSSLSQDIIGFAWWVLTLPRRLIDAMISL